MVDTPPATTTTTAATTTSAASPAAVTTSQALGVVTGFAHAIGTEDYSAAYQAWTRGGAASGSSEADFAAGYAATDRYDLHVTAVRPTGAGVDVDVVVLAVIDGYYAYIDAGDHGAAFTLWGGSGTSSGVTPGAFIDGYAATKSDTVTMGPFDESPGAGSLYAKVPTVVQATTTSGTSQLFCGTYTLRKSNLPPFDGLGWAIDTADLQPVAETSTDPGTLLASGCGG